MHKVSLLSLPTPTLFYPHVLITFMNMHYPHTHVHMLSKSVTVLYCSPDGCKNHCVRLEGKSKVKKTAGAGYHSLHFVFLSWERVCTAHSSHAHCIRGQLGWPAHYTWAWLWLSIALLTFLHSSPSFLSLFFSLTLPSFSLYLPLALCLPLPRLGRFAEQPPHHPLPPPPLTPAAKPKRPTRDPRLQIESPHGFLSTAFFANLEAVTVRYTCCSGPNTLA